MIDSSTGDRVKVVLTKVGGRDYANVFDEIFSAFGGLESLIEPGKRVLIKPNAVHFSPQTYTDPGVLESLLAYLIDHGFTELGVMENVTGGNFSRLVFHAIGYTGICKRYGAEPIFLDEGPTAVVRLRGEEVETRIPQRLHDDLVRHRQDSFYLSLPTLKTHSMSKVTLGVKNQQAFPIHIDRIHRHNAETLHHRLAALFQLIRPDFCIIEGLNAVIHGHFPATSLLAESTVPMDLMIGGADTLAVDAVGARVLGYSVDEVEHLRICREWGLGEGDLSNIEVVGESLEDYTERYPFELLGRYHPDVGIIIGRERACIEGCRCNSLCIQEMLANDHGGCGGWTLVFGKGIDKDQLADATGDILVIGPCASAELREWLPERFPDRKLYFVDACNDLARNTHYQAKLMGVRPLKLSPVGPLASVWLLLLARLHKTTARLPALLG
jgi:uncharacterized protein (DUF362 family)